MMSGYGVWVGVTLWVMSGCGLGAGVKMMNK